MNTISAEQAVLGALMLSKDAYWQVADILHVDDFSTGEHRLIAQGIAELTKNHKPCDAVTLAEWFAGQDIAELVGGMGYIIQLANNTPSAANIRAYAEIVASHAMRRRVIDVGAKIAKIEGNDSLAQAQALLHSLVDRVPIRLTSPREAFAEWVRTFKERMDRENDLHGLSTGFVDLDTALGGLHPGQLVIIAARPSMGKSLLAQNICDRVALAGNRTAFFSLEMTVEDLINRAIAAEAKVSHDRVRSAKGIEPYEWQRIEDVAGRIQKMPAVWSDASGQTIEQIISQIRREHARQPLQCAFIDYLGLIRLPSSEARHDLLVGSVVKQLKEQAKQLKIPIILLAQLNRGLESRAEKRPNLGDLRDSGEIEQHADVVIFIHRDDYHSRGEKNNIAELIIAKNRNGATGTVHVTARLDLCRFDNHDGPLPEKKIAAQPQELGGKNAMQYFVDTRTNSGRGRSK